MQKLLGYLVTQFQEFYRTLTPVKRVSMMVATAVVIIAVVIVALMVSGTNHVALLRNVPPDQLPIVVEQLNQKNIPFKLGDNGSSILVPKELLHSTQMAIMTEIGNGRLGEIGLELFEKENFGTTSYAQRVNYQRALQGELMRAINTLSAVKQSKVILALPPKKTFLEETGKPTASVVLDLHAGKSLTADQVRGITHLVASAVENLEAERVTVVDSRGKVLTRHFSPDAAATTELLEMKTKVEEGLEERIESILSKVVGNGKIIARVDASFVPKFLQQARAVPISDANGNISGFRLEWIQPGSFYEQLGLKPGDSLREVNGVRLTSVEKAVEIFEQFQNSSMIELKVDRNKKPLSLNYLIR